MLPSRSVKRLLLIGLLAWAAGVPSVRALASAGLLGPDMRVVLFAVTVPLTWAMVWAIGRIPSTEGVLPRLAVISTPPLLLDAAALGTAPWIYGPPDVQTAAAAYLLWFVGCTMAAALAKHIRSAPLLA